MIQLPFTVNEYDVPDTSRDPAVIVKLPFTVVFAPSAATSPELLNVKFLNVPVPLLIVLLPVPVNVTVPFVRFTVPLVAFTQFPVTTM